MAELPEWFQIYVWSIMGGVVLVLLGIIVNITVTTWNDMQRERREQTEAKWRSVERSYHG